MNSTTVSARIFKLTLTNISLFPDLKDYLKKTKGFEYGLCVQIKKDPDPAIMQIVVRYNGMKTFMLTRLFGCKVTKGSRNLPRDVETFKKQGESIWEEGILQPKKGKQVSMPRGPVERVRGVKRVNKEPEGLKQEVGKAGDADAELMEQKEEINTMKEKVFSPKNK